MHLPRSRSFSLLSAVILTGVLVAAGPALAASAAVGPTAGLDYVALGDSYAAGLGITPGTGAPVPGCAQAEQNYPHQVAAALGVNLTDVTCSGATAQNILTDPQTTPAGTAGVQSAALSADTDIVTVTIGGNDAGFGAVAAACIATSPTGPLLRSSGVPPLNCQSEFVVNGVDTLAANIALVVAPALQATYADIAAKAPNAEVFVVGYPSLMPDAANTPAIGCFTSPFTTNSVPYTDVDVAYIRSVEELLNTVSRDLATAAGFTFVENHSVSSANSACPQDADSYINGVSLNLLSNPPSASARSLHPNARGISFLTAQTVGAITTAFPIPTTPTVVIPGAPTTAGTGTAPALAATGPDVSMFLSLAGGLLAAAALIFGAQAYGTRRKVDAGS